MEIVLFERDSCECPVRIQDFFTKRQQSGFPSPGPGTIVTCDCGRTWTLEESPSSGRAWTEVPAK